MYLTCILQAQASLKRVSKFISGEDLDPGNVQHVFDTGNKAVPLL
jgi:hypothetical protein